jgi:hypothetical protein
VTTAPEHTHARLFTDPLEACLVDLTEGTHVGWGICTKLPSGTLVFEACPSAPVAITWAADLDSLRPGLGRPAMREIVVGGWLDSLDGNAYGVRITWPDGHTEVQPAADRQAAETDAGAYDGPGEADVASRWVVAGDWTLYDLPADTGTAA